MKICRELREFCGFERVPDADKFTLFRQDFVEYIGMVFERFVDATEPICKLLDPKKSGYLIYDPTGVEAYVKENNPKFLNSKLTQAKKIAATRLRRQGFPLFANAMTMFILSLKKLLMVNLKPSTLDIYLLWLIGTTLFYLLDLSDLFFDSSLIP